MGFRLVDDTVISAENLSNYIGSRILDFKGIFRNFEVLVFDRGDYCEASFSGRSLGFIYSSEGTAHCYPSRGSSAFAGRFEDDSYLVELVQEFLIDLVLLVPNRTIIKARYSSIIGHIIYE